MTMKLKIGFTVSAETLFGLMAKLLPIDDLHIEELGETARPSLAPAKAAPKQIGKPHKPPPKQQRRQSAGPDLKSGVNRIIVEALSGGPRRASEIKPLLKAAGYAESGIGSRLEKLRAVGIVHQPEFGLWQLTAKTEAAA
jgi:hypothetical protein